MREFVPCERDELLLVKILVMCLIEIADINAIIEIFRGDHNIGRGQIRPFTGRNPYENQ